MDLEKINHGILSLQNEVNYINNKINIEKDLTLKISKNMLQQIGLINGVLTKLSEIKNNIKLYRE